MCRDLKTWMKKWFRVISGGLIRCLDQCHKLLLLSPHLKRPIPVHTRIPHCEPGHNAIYGENWCGNEWINDLRLASIFGLSNRHAGLGSSPKLREDPQCVMGCEIEADMERLDPGSGTSTCGPHVITEGMPAQVSIFRVTNSASLHGMRVSA